MDLSPAHAECLCRAQQLTQDQASAILVEVVGRVSIARGLLQESFRVIRSIGSRQTRGRNGQATMH